MNRGDQLSVLIELVVKQRNYGSCQTEMETIIKFINNNALKANSTNEVLDAVFINQLSSVMVAKEGIVFTKNKHS